MLKVFKAYCDYHQLRARTFGAVFPQMYFFFFMYTHCEKTDGASCWDLFVETLHAHFL